eukprot:scaffold124064_cov30-Tisochrysis_lutea.AAC.2
MDVRLELRSRASAHARAVIHRRPLVRRDAPPHGEGTRVHRVSERSGVASNASTQPGYRDDDNVPFYRGRGAARRASAAPARSLTWGCEGEGHQLT